MKFIYKLLILIAVFAAGLYFFSSDITRTMFSTSAQTGVFGESRLPLVSIAVEDEEINLLHGYTSNLDETCIRECITPLGTDRAFTVLIDDKQKNVKKLKYEIVSGDGTVLESDSYTVLAGDGEREKVRVSLKETMQSGSEYMMKLTLITNESERIYYYTRLKMYSDGHLFEKLNFARSFSDTLINGSMEDKEQLKKYLESSKASDNSTFARVNIKSSYQMITWGDLEPVVIWQQVPTITEFYETMASVRIKSLVSVVVNGTDEYYVVTEDFRMLYTNLRMYLYNYDRSMESIFDVKNTSLLKNEFKLGITSDMNAQTASTAKSDNIAFVYGRELYEYTPKGNILTKVFSFATNTEDYARELYDAHEISLIKLKENGDIVFCVYGYMNAGEYEGRVGIILYKYIKSEKRIEEQLYIPITSSYQLLRSDMTGFEYLTENDVFYFSIYDGVYSYNLITREFNELAKNVPSSSLYFSQDEQYLIWQDNASLTKAKTISVLRLESGEIREIAANEHESLRLYGHINNNIIYGLARLSDVRILADGSCELPAYRLLIESPEGEILKTYEADGYYVDKVDIEDNLLIIKRVVKSSEAENIYSEASPDSVMNRKIEIHKAVEITKRVTDRVLTEYYISMPAGVNIETIPSLESTVQTVVNHDTTMRVAEPADRTLLYYAYSFGEVIFASDNAAEVIKAADEGVGTVINKDGRLVWERGVKANRTELGGINGIMSADDGYTSMQAVMKMLLEYRQSTIDTIGYDYTSETVYDWLRKNLNGIPVDLTGVSLDEALYSVYKKRPIIAVRAKGNAVLITAYDANTVTVWDPVAGKTQKLNLKDAAEDFERYGNKFISMVQ